jgi:hypothetical protein
VSDEKEVNFLDFELRCVWERFNELKARDFSNYTDLVKLYGLTILYASAPFYFAGFRDSGLLRVWGLGGVWLAGTTWFALKVPGLSGWMNLDRPLRASLLGNVEHIGDEFAPGFAIWSRGYQLMKESPYLGL